MDFGDLLQFLPPYLMIVVASIVVLGTGLKKSDLIIDKYIVFMLLIFGIVFSVLLDIISQEYKTVFESVVYGILHGIICWGVSVAGHQTFKQLQKEE